MEKIKITNFRKIKDTWDLDLAPITFFTGTNNSGKSSVLKALMVLSDFTNSDNHLLIAFNGKSYPKHKIDCFSNAANWSNNENKDISFEIQPKNYSITISFSPLTNDVNSGKYARGQLASIAVSRDSDGATFKMEKIAGSTYQMSVNSLLLEKSNLSNKEDSVKIELEQLRSFLKQILKNIEELEGQLLDFEKEKKEIAHLANGRTNAIQKKFESKRVKYNEFLADTKKINNLFGPIQININNILPDLEFYNNKRNRLIEQNDTKILSLKKDLEDQKQKKHLADQDNQINIDFKKQERFIRRTNESIDLFNNEIYHLENHNKVLSDIDLDKIINDINRSEKLINAILHSSASPKKHNELFHDLLTIKKDFIQIKDLIDSSGFKNDGIIKSINNLISKLKEVLFDLEIFKDDDEVKDLEKELMNIIDQKESNIIKINKKTQLTRVEISTLKEKVRDIKNKIKQIEKKNDY